MGNTILFRVDLIRFRKDLSVYMRTPGPKTKPFSHCNPSKWNHFRMYFDMKNDGSFSKDLLKCEKKNEIIVNRVFSQVFQLK